MKQINSAGIKFVFFFEKGTDVYVKVVYMSCIGLLSDIYAHQWPSYAMLVGRMLDNVVSPRHHILIILEHTWLMWFCN